MFLANMEVANDVYGDDIDQRRSQGRRGLMRSKAEDDKIGCEGCRGCHQRMALDEVGEVIWWQR